MLLKFRDRLNEKGSLPAIMGAAILISATAVLLGAFAIATTRNAEISISKTSLNAAITSCETTLASTVQRSFFRDVEAGDSNLLNMQAGADPTDTDKSLRTIAEQTCNYPAVNTEVRLTSVENYKVNATDETPQSVKATLTATYDGIGGGTETQIKYLDYPVLAPGQYVGDESYILSFNEQGHAVWVNLLTDEQ